MKAIKLTLFKISNEVVVTEEGDLTLDQIDRMKNIICEECECTLEEISIEFVEQDIIHSDFDVGCSGMYNYADCYFNIKTGVKLCINEGSDLYLDAMNKGNLEEFLIFV